VSNLGELYQSLILDHNRAPRNYRAMPDADSEAEGYNPLCGDQLSLYLKFDGDRIADVSFQGNGCAISRASASLMTTEIKGKTRQEAARMFEGFHRMITGGGAHSTEKLPPKLGAFAGVAEFPARVKCAALAWHALRQALDEGTDTPMEKEHSHAV
jgi:nitrogen fixation protein NifU and related proteins